MRLASPPHAPGAWLANLSLCAAGHQTAAVLSMARRAAARTTVRLSGRTTARPYFSRMSDASGASSQRPARDSRPRPPSGSAACANVPAKLLNALKPIISDGPAFAAGAAADGAVETSLLDSGPVAAVMSALLGRAGSATRLALNAPIRVFSWLSGGWRRPCIATSSATIWRACPPRRPRSGTLPEGKAC